MNSFIAGYMRIDLNQFDRRIMFLLSTLFPRGKIIYILGHGWNKLLPTWNKFLKVSKGLCAISSVVQTIINITIWYERFTRLQRASDMWYIPFLLGNIWFAHIMIMIANGSYLSTFICTFNTFVRPTPIMFVVVFGRKPLCSTLYERWNDAFSWCEIKTDEIKIVSLIPRWYQIEC